MADSIKIPPCAFQRKANSSILTHTQSPQLWFQQFSVALAPPRKTTGDPWTLNTHQHGYNLHVNYTGDLLLQYQTRAIFQLRSDPVLIQYTSTDVCFNLGLNYRKCGREQTLSAEKHLFSSASFPRMKKQTWCNPTENNHTHNRLRL